MFAHTAQTLQKADLFEPVQQELLDRLDEAAQTLTRKPARLFPLSPSQVRELLA